MKLFESEKILTPPESWQGDPLRCVDCGELIEWRKRTVVFDKGNPTEKRIIVPSVGCECNRRPTLSKP
jgi:hypothetical protein